MTKQEYIIICKFIDLRIVKNNIKDEHESFLVDYYDVEGLKKDIKDCFLQEQK